MNRGSVPYPCGRFGKFINSLMESAGREPMEMFELMNWTLDGGKGLRRGRLR